MSDDTAITYSRLSLTLVLATCYSCGLALLAGGIATSQTTATATGAAFTAISLTATWGTRKVYKTGAVALARRGELLVGGELRAPLEAASTVYELVDTRDGAWLIALHQRDTIHRISPSGLRTANGRRLTRPVAEATLQQLGIEPFRVPGTRTP